jgi:iron complex outermembrane receptor protein
MDTSIRRIGGLVLILAVAASAAQSAAADTAAGSTAEATAAPESTLEEIVITAAYREEGANSSMKSGIPVRDTPMSVDNYTSSFMTSIETVQVADLYRYMTGLQKAGGTGYDLTLRGFSTTDTDRNTVMTDGLPGLSVRFGSPPTIGTDHIELVKGAASLLYGLAEPGGFVNIISKKPQEKPLTELETRGTVNASSYSRVHGGDVSIDSTGPLTGDSVLYRVVAQLSDDDRFRNLSYERGQYLLPSVTFKLGATNKLTAQLEYRASTSNYASFFLLAPRTATAATVAQLAPIQTNYMQPGNYLNERGVTASLFASHDFGDGAVWNLSIRSVDHHDYAHAFDIGPFDKADPTFQTLDLRARGQTNQRTYNFGDTYLVLPFMTGGIGHRAIVGANVGKEIDDFLRTQFCNINAPGRPNADSTCNLPGQLYTISVMNPDFSTIPSFTAFGPGKIGASTLAHNYVTSETTGAYASDLMSLTSSWKVMLGLRYSRDKLTDNLDLFEPTQPTYEQTTSSVLPQVGVLYQPNMQWSYYASYSTSYTPVDPSNVGLTTSPTFKPTEGHGGEVGVKADLDDGRMGVTAALFSIEQKNVLAPYPGGTDQLCPSGSCSIQVGAARSKGAELEVDAKPVPQWTLIAGYAYTDARVSASNSLGPLVDHVLPNSPFNAAHVWSRYDFLSGALAGFGVGLGYSYVSTRLAVTGTAALPGEFVLPSYQVFDLGLYKLFSSHFDATIKVNNLFDKRYYQSGTITQGMVNVQAGFPRTAELYLRARL